ncbi:hypothetical protein MNBD_DELTA01-868 [hydrothermal vent metagenome]|uniref:Glycosyl transferase family 1 domain-containing protein n=1 Tax=hydrothermal vent metagenome TaxID=652676 RepID=A0A3B0QU82_9ZZZZ
MSKADNKNKINLLGICLDFRMLEKDLVGGDVDDRQKSYASYLNHFYQIVYSKKSRAAYRKFCGDEQLTLIPTDSINRVSFILDALRIGWRMCRNNKIDALTTEDPFTTGLVGLILKKRFRLPLNIQIHNDFFDNPYWIDLRFINRVFNKLGKFTLKYADTIRVGTEYEKKKLCDLGLASEKIRVIPVYADVERFSSNEGDLNRGEFLKEAGLGRYEKLIVSTGRLEPQKDYPVLIKAMAEVTKAHPEAVLCLLGEGSDRARITREIEQQGVGDNVILTGAVAHQDVARYLNASDLFVMPSIYEGTCIALAEACFAGKPVVATAFAGAHELVIDGKTGFRVTIRDVSAIAEKITFLLENTKSAVAMGDAGRNHVKGLFNKDHNIRGVVRMWEDTAGIAV